MLFYLTFAIFSLFAEPVELISATMFYFVSFWLSPFQQPQFPQCSKAVLTFQFAGAALLHLFLEILLNFKTNANTLLILFCLLFDLSSMMTLALKESLVSYHILTFSKQVSFKPLVSWPVRLRFVLTYWIRVIF